eukprot:m.286162 g.286162  ORF g.286162 m.286162 type:complete len:193 (+) comp19437_c1_seq2:698-1276(+)
MALINVTDVSVLNNPARFTDAFQFKITFECLQDLAGDIEWKLIYVGSAESESHDQLLDTVLVGPVPAGCNEFVFQADAPDPAKIPGRELLGVTIVLLTCSYSDAEFIRVGYYVNNEYIDQELRDNPPEVARPDVAQVGRNILATKPRVTRFPIAWEGGAAAMQMEDHTQQKMAMQLQMQREIRGDVVEPMEM